MGREVRLVRSEDVVYFESDTRYTRVVHTSAGVEGQALWAHCSTHLHVLERAHPFGTATLADEDLAVDFAAHTTPQDRVAIIATTPLTEGEPWHALAPGEMRVLVGGRTVASGPCGR